MADIDAEVGTVQPKKRTFKKFTFRGVDLDALLDMSSDELVELFHARARRRFQRGLKRKPMALIKKLRKAKREAPAGEKPEPVRTHLRNMIIVPEMIGSVIGVYNGKTFNQVEIKTENGAFLGMRAQRKVGLLSAGPEFPELACSMSLPGICKEPSCKMRNLMCDVTSSVEAEILLRPEMIGHYLAEFSISYKPVKHGRPGIGATHSSRFIPLK